MSGSKIVIMPREISTFPDTLHEAGLVPGSPDTSAGSIRVCHDYDRTTYANQYSPVVNTFGAHFNVVGYNRNHAWVHDRVPRANVSRPTGVVLAGTAATRSILRMSITSSIWTVFFIAS